MNVNIITNLESKNDLFLLISNIMAGILEAWLKLVGLLNTYLVTLAIHKG